MRTAHATTYTPPLGLGAMQALAGRLRERGDRLQRDLSGSPTRHQLRGLRAEAQAAADLSARLLDLLPDDAAASDATAKADPAATTESAAGGETGRRAADTFLRLWLQRRTVEDAAAETAVTALLDDYQRWLTSRGMRVTSRADFVDALVREGFPPVATGRHSMLPGLRLLPQGQHPADAARETI